MEEEIFSIQTSPSALSNFLQIKSFGKQFSDLQTTIVPTVDITDYVYDASYHNAQFVALGATAIRPITSGNGIYRIDGNLSLSINNGANAGLYTLSLEMAGPDYFCASLFIPANTNSNTNHNLLFYVDQRRPLAGNVTQATFRLDGPAGGSPVYGTLNVRIQRVI